ncbi:hypothetical protein niasHT_038217 [Heterodera trifolii]|uniref:Metaxin glutathione S-transferase domain-containing protein n=1 Tax=Heterodera trifolii TaxID=157864 RepID=A0ABD2IXR3_9BILA
MAPIFIPIALCILLHAISFPHNVHAGDDASDDEQNYPVLEPSSSTSSFTDTEKSEDDSDSSGYSSNQTPSKKRWGKVRKHFLKETEWNKIADYLNSDVLPNYRKEVYLHKMMGTTQYKLPPPFTGIVKAVPVPKSGKEKVKYGAWATWCRWATEYGRVHAKFMKKHGNGGARFQSDQETVETIMLYVQKKLDKMVKSAENNEKTTKMKQEFDEVHKNMPEDGCKISFAHENRTLSTAYLFNQGLEDEEEEEGNTEEEDDDDNAKSAKTPPFLFKTNDEEDTVKDDNEDDDDDDEESADETTTYAVMQAIQHGRAGFGKDAKLDWTHLPAYKEEKEIPPNFFQKCLNRMKYIYESIKASVVNGKKWVVEKWWHKKETKNVPDFEWKEQMLTEHTDKLTPAQKAEIAEKATSGIVLIEKMRKYMSSDNTGNDLVEPLLKQNDDDDDAIHEQHQQQQHLEKPEKKSSAKEQSSKKKKSANDEIGAGAKEEGSNKKKKGEATSRKDNYNKLMKLLKQQQVHPFDFLAGTVQIGQGGGERIEIGGIRYMISGQIANKKKWEKIVKKNLKKSVEMDNANATCDRLAKLVANTLYMDNAMDPQGIDMRGRLSAQMINNVNTQKDMNGIASQMLLSILGSGLIALFFDAFLWPIVIGVLTPIIGPWVIPLSIALYSITPLFAETFDSLVIKRTIASSRGAPFIPKKAVLMQNLHAALASGSIAAVGSVANNGMEFVEIGLYALPFLTMTNMLATATSAAMVPAEIQDAEDETKEHVLRLIEKGVFPMPKNLEKQKKQMSKKEVNEALEQFVSERVDRVMDLTKTTGMARNSMSTGIVLSLTVGFAPFYALQTLGLIGANVVKIILIMFNAPTEILSMGIDRIMSTMGGWDAKKNRRMVGLIMRKAIEQLEGNDAGMAPISEDDVYRVYYSNTGARLMNKFGKGVVKLFSSPLIGRFFKYCGGKIAWAVSKLAKMPLVRNLVGAIRKIREDLQYKFLPLLGKKNIVENWKENVIYLITYPRLSATKTGDVPVISPAALKLEAWLKLRKFTVYRVTSGFLFADLFGQQRVPFVELNGKQLIGTTDQIIERLEKWHVAKKSAHLTMDKENMKHHGYKDKDGRKELRRKERLIRRTFDEIVSKCLMKDREKSIDIPYSDHFINISVDLPKNELGFLWGNRALFKQMMATMPRLYPKWFNNNGTLVMKNATFWEEFWVEYFKSEKARRKYRPGYEILSADEQMLKDLRDQDVPKAMFEIFRRYKRKLFNEVKSQKVREYIEEIDSWEVKHHPRNEVTKEMLAIKYSELNDDQIVAKVINAMKLAADQLKKTMKKQTVLFLFGDRPTPADASLFAHLVQLFETPLKTKKLDKHIKEVKEQFTHDQHVLLEYVEKIKNEIGWEQMKYSSEKPDEKPFNFEWVKNVEEMKKYEGPFELKFKNDLEFDPTFMEFTEDEEKYEEEEFGANDEPKEEEEEENSAQTKEKKTGKEQGGDSTSKEETEEAEKQRYTWEQLVTFDMFNEEETWKILVKRRHLYEEPKDPGNFLWRYPKVVEFVTRRILRITDCEYDQDNSQTAFGPWVYALENGLDKTEHDLEQIEPFKPIANIKRQKDNKRAYSFNKWMLARKRTAAARALLHLMALQFCKRFAANAIPLSSNPAQNGGSGTQQIPEGKCEAHKQHAFVHLEKEGAAKMIDKCEKFMKKLIDQIYDNYGKLNVPVYSLDAEVTSFKPIAKPVADHALFTYVTYNDASRVEHVEYRVDPLLLYYYPDVVHYVLHAMMDVAGVSSAVPLQSSFTYFYRRVLDDAKLRNKRDQLMHAMKKTVGASKMSAEKREHVADALVRFAAAFICVGKIEADDCDIAHRKQAGSKLKSVIDKSFDESISIKWEKHVKLFVHQFVVSYNELIAEEELDKYSTKIVADLELLPKGPGFFERMQKEYRTLNENPPKEVKAEVEAEMEKNKRSPELQRMQQRTGFMNNLQQHWQTEKEDL